MHIQWYPGHMTKAMRMMQDNMRVVDCVIYVLDSRAVSSCLNPQRKNAINSNANSSNASTSSRIDPINAKCVARR